MVVDTMTVANGRVVTIPLIHAVAFHHLQEKASNGVFSASLRHVCTSSSTTSRARKRELTTRYRQHAIHSDLQRPGQASSKHAYWTKHGGFRLTALTVGEIRERYLYRTDASRPCMHITPCQPHYLLYNVHAGSVCTASHTVPFTDHPTNITITALTACTAPFIPSVPSHLIRIHPQHRPQSPTPVPNR